MITKNKQNSAFTVIEIVVSLAVTSVIALFVFSFATSLADLWRNTESGVSTELDAQIALDQIVKDLESAILRESQNPMFAVTTIAKNGSEDTAKGELGHSFSTRWVNASNAVSSRPESLHFDPEEHHYGWAGQWLRFYTASPSANAVGYQIIRKSAFTQSTGVRYLLHRSVVRHDLTVAAGFNITSPNYKGTAGTDVSPEVIERPRINNLFLEDVIDFGVRLYVFDDSFPGNDDAPEGLRLIFPSSDNALLDDGERVHYGQTWVSKKPDGSNNYDQRYPDVVEIYIRVLDDAGANELFQSEEIEARRTYEEIVKDHSRLYRRMVRLPGREAES